MEIYTQKQLTPPLDALDGAVVGQPQGGLFVSVEEVADFLVHGHLVVVTRHHASAVAALEKQGVESHRVDPAPGQLEVEVVLAANENLLMTKDYPQLSNI